MESVSQQDLPMVSQIPQTCDHEAAMEDPLILRSGSSNSVEASSSYLHLADCAPDTDARQVDSEREYGPVIDMSSEAHDFLAAIFEATAHRALNPGAMDPDVPDYVATLQSSLADLHDPARNLMSMVPPQKFYRRQRRSVSLRHQCG